MGAIILVGLVSTWPYLAPPLFLLLSPVVAGGLFRNVFVGSIRHASNSTHRTDGVLYLRWAPGTRINHAVAVEAARELAALSQGEVLPLIVIMAGIDGLTLTARMGMNAYQGFAQVALIGDGPVDEVLAGFACNSLTTTRYFTSETEGLAWLRQEDRHTVQESAA